MTVTIITFRYTTGEIGKKTCNESSDGKKNETKERRVETDRRTCVDGENFRDGRQQQVPNTIRVFVRTRTRDDNCVPNVDFN